MSRIVSYVREQWRLLFGPPCKEKFVMWEDPDGFLWIGWECKTCRQIHDMHRVVRDLEQV